MSEQQPPAPRARRPTGHRRPNDVVVDLNEIPERALEFVGFSPTPYQQRCKSRFWATVRDDPLIDPASMSGTDVAITINEPSVRAWWRDPDFVTWFLNGDQWRQSIEWLHDLWVERCFAVLIDPVIQTKDFIALGRELAKMTGRSGPTAADPNDPKKAMTPEAARAMVAKVARQMGWTPPAGELTTPPATLPVEEPENDE